MSRSRASVSGGYVRKTVSLPASLISQVECHLVSVPGLTLSSFASEAMRVEIERLQKKRKK